MGLGDERCGACDRNTPPLFEADICALLEALDPDWSVVGGRLVRTWRFPDFASALRFVNEVGAVAEAEGHHPDLHLSWGRVRIEICTHAIGALSRADFVLAAKLGR